MRDRITKHIERDVILMRLSRHLARLAQRVQTLENAISEGDAGSMEVSAQSITHLQALDYLRQSLEDMEKVVRIIASSQRVQPLNGRFLDGAARTLKLASSRSIFVGDDTVFTDQDPGDVDLF